MCNNKHQDININKHCEPKKIETIEFNEMIKEEKIIRGIKTLPNWKTSDGEMIFNFTIKKLKSLHKTIAKLIIKIINGDERFPEGMTEGRTFLKPKKINEGDDGKGSYFKHVTCLNTLYKLTTKIISDKISLTLHNSGYITNNEL